MSFGWSVGDLVAAIKLLTEVAATLDDVGGASSEYQESARFLRSLIHTLEPLRNLDNINISVSYKEEICSEVESIRVPVEDFLSFIKKYEAGLGAQAPTGRHRNIRQKLQWHFGGDLKKLEKLQVRIERHMTTLDALLQRLIIDLITNAQMNLPDQLRTAFTEVLDGRLQSEFREELLPIQGHLLELREQVSQSHQALLEYLEKNQLITMAVDTVLRTILDTQKRQIGVTSVPARSALPLLDTPIVAANTVSSNDHQEYTTDHVLDLEKYDQMPLPKSHILQVGQFRAEKRLNTRLEEWWINPKSQLLWVQEPLNTSISYIASSIYLAAETANISVAGYLNQRGFYDKTIKRDPHELFLRMIYSMILQMTDNITKSSICNHGLKRTWSKGLDGSLSSLEIAFSILRELLLKSTGPQIIVTDGLHLIDRGTDPTLRANVLKLLEVLRSSGMNQDKTTIAPLIKVLIVTPGQTLTLLDTVEWNEKLDITVAKGTHYLPLVAELKSMFRSP